jgi:hypothetical protein
LIKARRSDDSIEICRSSSSIDIHLTNILIDVRQCDAAMGGMEAGDGTFSSIGYHAMMQLFD